jgi:hypothetical protein
VTEHNAELGIIFRCFRIPDFDLHDDVCDAIRLRCTQAPHADRLSLRNCQPATPQFFMLSYSHRHRRAVRGFTANEQNPPSF